MEYFYKEINVIRDRMIMLEKIRMEKNQAAEEKIIDPEIKFPNSFFKLLFSYYIFQKKLN